MIETAFADRNRVDQRPEEQLLIISPLESRHCQQSHMVICGTKGVKILGQIYSSGGVQKGARKNIAGSPDVRQLSTDLLGQVMAQVDQCTGLKCSEAPPQVRVSLQLRATRNGAECVTVCSDCCVTEVLRLPQPAVVVEQDAVELAVPGKVFVQLGDQAFRVAVKR